MLAFADLSHFSCVTFENVPPPNAWLLRRKLWIPVGQEVRLVLDNEQLGVMLTGKVNFQSVKPVDILALSLTRDWQNLTRHSRARQRLQASTGFHSEGDAA